MKRLMSVVILATLTITSVGCGCGRWWHRGPHCETCPTAPGGCQTSGYAPGGLQAVPGGETYLPAPG